MRGKPFVSLYSEDLGGGDSGSKYSLPPISGKAVKANIGDPFAEEPESYATQPEYYSEKLECHSKKSEYYSKKLESHSEKSEHYSANNNIIIKKDNNNNNGVVVVDDNCEVDGDL